MLSTLKTLEAQAEAESEYNAALDVNPSDAQAECRLGDIAAKRNDLQEAPGPLRESARATAQQSRRRHRSCKSAGIDGSARKAARLLEHAIQIDRQVRSRIFA